MSASIDLVKEDMKQTFKALHTLLELDTPENQRTMTQFNQVCKSLIDSVIGESGEVLSREHVKEFMETMRRDMGMHSGPEDLQAMDEVYLELATDASKGVTREDMRGFLMNYFDNQIRDIERALRQMKVDIE